jgi:peptidyl-prolyl cis-trans isomerase SurA
MRFWKLAAAACATGAAVAVMIAWPPRFIASAQALQPDTASASETLVDKVVATIEDRAIMKSDVDNELKRFLLQAQRASLPADEEKNVRGEILNGLIADALMSIQAEKEDIKVDDKEVDAAVERTIDDNRTSLGGDDAFNAQLASEGLTIEGLRSIYREKLKNRMLIERLMYQKVMGDTKVTEGEVVAYYKTHGSELPQRPPTVSIAHILIVPKPSEAVLTKALEKITMIEGKVKEGGDFAALAKEYSDCPSAKFGGSLGLMNLDDLNNPAFEEAARKLTAGEVSPPVLTDFGYHLIKLEGVEGDKVNLRHILVRAQATPDDLENAAKLAEGVRSELLAGADFAAAAAKYSDDYGTKNSGGMIGEVPLENLPELFKETIKGVPAGEVAPVIKEAKGFRVVKVLSWNAGRAYTYDEAKDELRKVLAQQRIQERLGAYVEELKKDYFVEIKGD